MKLSSDFLLSVILSYFMNGTKRTGLGTKHPRTKQKGDLFVPEGQRPGNQRRRQEIEDKGEKRNKGKGNAHLP